MHWFCPILLNVRLYHNIIGLAIFVIGYTEIEMNTHFINRWLNHRKLENVLKACRRVNIGCGYCIENDWINIDNFANPFLTVAEKKVLKREPNFVELDVIYDWAIPKKTLTTIYASHFIEHIERQKAAIFIKNCHQSLKTRGVMRIVCPDLNKWTRWYLNQSPEIVAFHNKWKSYPKLSNHADIFVGQFYGWGHKWMYDQLSLKQLLIENGFKSNNITFKHFLDSEIDNLDKLEIKEREFESFYVEAVR